METATTAQVAQKETTGSIIITTSVFLKHLRKMSGIIKGNPIVPITEYVRLEVISDECILEGTNLSTFVKTDMSVDFPMDKKGDFSVCIPVKKIIQLLLLLADQPLAIFFNGETHKMEIKTDSGTFRFETMHYGDFPKASYLMSEITVKTSGQALLESFNTVEWAVSHNESRPALTTVLIKTDSTCTTFVSTDGHRLARYRRFDITSEKEYNVLLGLGDLRLLKPLLKKTDIVTIGFSQKSIAFLILSENGTRVEFFARNIEEVFPDYENVIPTNNPNRLTFDRKEMINKARISRLFANQYTHQLRLELDADNQNLTSGDIDESLESEQKVNFSYAGEKMSVGLNSSFFLEGLLNMKSDMITMFMSMPNKACVLEPIQQNAHDNLTVLIMPVKLNEYNR